MSYLYLLNLRPQFLQCAVAVYPVGDIIPEAVAKHALAVRFPDTVALTQSAKGVSGSSPGLISSCGR